jgi:hypothetical protein
MPTDRKNKAVEVTNGADRRGCPWIAAWDLAFPMIPFVRIYSVFATGVL